MNAVSLPTSEVDAAEKVLADWMDEAPDGYFRSIAGDVLIAAGRERTRLTGVALDALYSIMVMEDGRAGELAAEAYHEIRGHTREAADARFDLALGQSRN